MESMTFQKSKCLVQWKILKSQERRLVIQETENEKKVTKEKNKLKAFVFYFSVNSLHGGQKVAANCSSITKNPEGKN